MGNPHLPATPSTRAIVETYAKAKDISLTGAAAELIARGLQGAAQGHTDAILAKAVGKAVEVAVKTTVREKDRTLLQLQKQHDKQLAIQSQALTKAIRTSTGPPPKLKPAPATRTRQKTPSTPRPQKAQMVSVRVCTRHTVRNCFRCQAAEGNDQVAYDQDRRHGPRLRLGYSKPTGYWTSMKIPEAEARRTITQSLQRLTRK